MSFLSDGSIDFNAEDVGMMDLWAGSHFLRVQGDALYVKGMQLMNEQAGKKPHLVIAKEIPEARA